MQFINGFLGNDPNTIYNTHGHRCIEPTEINTRNHFLIVGDNAGLCLDKPIEETFPHLLSKKLNINYYNLCIFNGGVDAIKLNLFSWLSKHESPKFIIFACEFANAVMLSDTEFTFLTPANLNDNLISDLNHHANHCGFFVGRNKLLDTLVSNLIKIPTYQLVWKNKTQLLSNSFDILVDNLSQSEVADSIYNNFVARNNKVRAI